MENTEPNKARPKPDMFQCKVCPYNTLRKPFLDKHMQQKHGFSKVEPDNPISNKRTRRRDKQKSVKRKNIKEIDSDSTDDLELECEMCDDVVLHKHLETHETDDKEMYQCTQCDFKTTEISALRSHQGIHQKVELFKCPNCEYASRHKWNFRIHLKIHEDPAKLEEFQCKFCDSFKSLHKSSLYKHISLKHSDEQKILQCSKCSYITPNRSHLIVHLKTHIDPSMLPTYHCDICDFETHNESSIRKHVNNHKELQEMGEDLIVKDGVTQVVWFCCDRCEFRSNYQRYLIRHKKSHAHADEINRIGKSILYGKNSVIDVEESV